MVAHDVVVSRPRSVGVRFEAALGNFISHADLGPIMLGGNIVTENLMRKYLPGPGWFYRLWNPLVDVPILNE